MKNMVYDKTDKGREEIATRQHRLPTRLRTLLLLVDGKQSVADLLAKIGSLGLTEESIGELVENGFIQAASAQAPQPAAPAPVEQAAAAAEPVRQPVVPDGRTQFEAIYQFYTSTIKSTIGLRGYGLQLKVEKAASIDEFRQLRRPYLEAVLKAQGEEMARSLRDRLDQLLNADSNGGGAEMGNTLFAAHIAD